MTRLLFTLLAAASLHGVMAAPAGLNDAAVPTPPSWPTGAPTGGFPVPTGKGGGGVPTGSWPIPSFPTGGSGFPVPTGKGPSPGTSGTAVLGARQLTLPSSLPGTPVPTGKGTGRPTATRTGKGKGPKPTGGFSRPPQ